MGQHVQFFVKVDGRPHSAHRSAQGVYEVSILDDKAREALAREALEAVVSAAPFLSDHAEQYQIHVYDQTGQEINPVSSTPEGCEIAYFLGRATQFPDIIDLQ